MKFTLLFITLSALLSSICASVPETNAVRLARGLSPLPPVRRATPVAAARRSRTSPHPNNGIKHSCNTGTVTCCNSFTNANPTVVKILSGLLGIVVPADAAVGYSCHPLSVVGRGKNNCNQQPVCCQNNQMHGLIVIGCSPITINA